MIDGDVAVLAGAVGIEYGVAVGVGTATTDGSVVVVEVDGGSARATIGHIAGRAKANTRLTLILFLFRISKPPASDET